MKFFDKLIKRKTLVRERQCLVGDAGKKKWRLWKLLGRFLYFHAFMSTKPLILLQCYGFAIQQLDSLPSLLSLSPFVVSFPWLLFQLRLVKNQSLFILYVHVMCFYLFIFGIIWLFVLIRLCQLGMLKVMPMSSNWFKSIRWYYYDFVSNYFSFLYFCLLILHLIKIIWE